MVGLDPVPLVRAIFRFFSGSSVVRVSGVGSGFFVPTGIESIGDAVFFCRVCTKRIRVQIWSTHRIILVPIILIFHPSFKISFSIIVFL